MVLRIPTCSNGGVQFGQVSKTGQTGGLRAWKGLRLDKEGTAVYHSVTDIWFFLLFR